MVVRRSVVDSSICCQSWGQCLKMSAEPVIRSCRELRKGEGWVLRRSGVEQEAAPGGRNLCLPGTDVVNSSSSVLNKRAAWNGLRRSEDG